MWEKRRPVLMLGLGHGEAAGELRLMAAPGLPADVAVGYLREVICRMERGKARV